MPEERREIRARFVNLIDNRIYHLLPPECREASRQAYIRLEENDGKVGIIYVAREGARGRRSDKSRPLKYKHIEQELKGFLSSERELSRLWVIIETDDYFFEYSI